MNPDHNPYTPGAGAPPPELAGRDSEIASFDLLLTRLGSGLHERSMLLQGVRGTGKTVLLNAMRDRAINQGWDWVKIELNKSSPLSSDVLYEVRALLLQMKPSKRLAGAVRSALSVVKSFSLTLPGDFKVSIEVDPTPGKADSGNLARDLTDVFSQLGELERERHSGLVFLVDELHLASQQDYEALIVALHEFSQSGLPVTLVGAGLPQLPALSRTAKTYAERLFLPIEVGALTPEDSRAALVVPAKRANVSYTAEALEMIIADTGGYPYFLQEYGKFAWNVATRPTITATDVSAASAMVQRHLDSTFFRTRLSVTAKYEQEYLLAMAALGPGPHKSKAISQRYKGSSGKPRASLIEKGLLYSPTYGETAFSVPQLDAFLRRNFDVQ